MSPRVKWRSRYDDSVLERSLKYSNGTSEALNHTSPTSPDGSGLASSSATTTWSSGTGLPTVPGFCNHVRASTHVPRPSVAA